MRRQITRLIMLLIVLGSLLAGCGQQKIDPSAPAASDHASTQAAAQAVSAARIQHLTRMAQSSAIAGKELARVLRNPEESVGLIPDLVKRLSTAGVANTFQGQRISLWERFAQRQSPVLKRAEESQDTWRTWADEVVERYN